MGTATHHTLSINTRATKHPQAPHAIYLLAKRLGTRKHLIDVTVHSDGIFRPRQSYWDGGSRTETWFVSTTGHNVNVPLTGGSGFPSFKDPDPVTLNDGVVGVEGGTFRGKAAHLRLHVNRTTAERLGLKLEETCPKCGGEITEANRLIYHTGNVGICYDCDIRRLDHGE